jgi:hypothetical protein
MQKELLEQIIKKAKGDNKGMYVVLSSISSHGGYSSSSTRLYIDPNRVSVILDPLCVRILGEVSLDITTMHEKTYALYIPYEQILFVGIN